MARSASWGVLCALVCQLFTCMVISYKDSCIICCVIPALFDGSCACLAQVSVCIRRFTFIWTLANCGYSDHGACRHHSSQRCYRMFRLFTIRAYLTLVLNHESIHLLIDEVVRTCTFYVHHVYVNMINLPSCM